MKEPKLERGNSTKETEKRGDVKPERPEQPARRPNPTPNPPKKK